MRDNTQCQEMHDAQKKGEWWCLRAGKYTD
jgi:hypothetical protein